MQPSIHIALAATLGAAAMSSAAHAQFQIDWFTIDAGGGTSSGGAFIVSGTIGQPDAGTTAGGTFQCNGGFWAATVTPSCYADCDHIGGLTANDFQCFLNAFVSANTYANCDNTGGLTANDFQCFLDAFVAGCS